MCLCTRMQFISVIRLSAQNCQGKLVRWMAGSSHCNLAWNLFSVSSFWSCISIFFCHSLFVWLLNKWLNLPKTTQTKRLLYPPLWLLVMSSISSSRLCTQARKAIRPHLISGRSLMGCQGNRRQFNWASVNALAGCDRHRQTMTVEWYWRKHKDGMDQVWGAF